MEIGIAEMSVFDKNKEDGGYQYPPCSRYNCGHHWPSLQRTLAEGPLPLRASVDIGAWSSNRFHPKDPMAHCCGPQQLALQRILVNFASE